MFVCVCISSLIYKVIFVFKAGVCRPCDTIELTATSCNFSLCIEIQLIAVVRELRSPAS